MRVFIDTNLWLYRLDRRGTLSWFDALIAEAAIRSRCAILFSENFSHGRRIGGLVVINPFLEPSVVP
jgi:predicted nucleic acid-binding protein